MKKGFWILVVFGFVGFVLSKDAQAAWPWQNEGAKKVVAPAQKQETSNDSPVASSESVKKEATAAAVQASPKTTDIEKQRALREKKKAALNSHEWEVEVIAMSGKGVKQSDILVFSESKFFSEVFSKLGFEPTNYTVTAQDDGATVVESMQSADKEGIVFWRIEFDKDLAGCKGIYSRQLSQNKTEDYSFTSLSKKPYVHVAKSEAPAADKKADPAPDAEKRK
jgi:hypothetical protein